MNLIRKFAKKQLRLIKLENYIYTSILLTSLAIDFIYIGSNLFIPLLSSILLSYLGINFSIEKLKNLNFRHIIKEEGPKSHKSKGSVPTLGGSIFIPIGIIIGSIATASNENFNQILAIDFLTICYMLIGLTDDYQSIRKKTNIGINGTLKIILQLIIAIIFISIIWTQGWINTEINLSESISFDLNNLIAPLAIFVLIAESNATNLTDGLDGLVSGCSALVFAGLSIYITINNGIEDYYLATYSIAMSGSILGFLCHNKIPAKLYMGDTGSLAIGGALGSIALLSNTLWPLFLMGGVFVAESLSVIIQVLSFKITKKTLGKGYRIFKMAPLHHHFELIGNPERVVVANFWLTTFILVLIVLMLSLLS